MTEYILAAIHCGQRVGAVFIDVSKAFDKVWHNGLIFKLIQHKLPLQQIQLLANYLSGRTFKIKHLGAYSNAKPIQSGVAQGSPIAPILFNIFVSDIPKPQPTGLRAKYADDTAIMYRSKNLGILNHRLQQHLDQIESWCHKWRLQLIASKSTAILFSKGRGQPTDNLPLDLRPIPWRDKVT